MQLLAEEVAAKLYVGERACADADGDAFLFSNMGQEDQQLQQQPQLTLTNDLAMPEILNRALGAVNRLRLRTHRKCRSL